MKQATLYGIRDLRIEDVPACAVGGRIGLVGIPEEDNVPLAIHQARRRELTLYNVRRSRFTIPKSIELVRRGRIDLDAPATHFFPLERTREALELAAGYADGVRPRGVIKAVLGAHRTYRSEER